MNITMNSSPAEMMYRIQELESDMEQINNHCDDLESNPKSLQAQIGSIANIVEDALGRRNAAYDAGVRARNLLEAAGAYSDNDFLSDEGYGEDAGNWGA